jgi:hypothetical protein
MTAKPSPAIQNQEEGSSNLTIGLARLYWAIFGPGFLIGSLALSVAGPKGWLTGRDLVPFLVLGAMILCRWMEQRTGKATTAYGDPSTPRDFHLWAVIVSVIAVVGWIIANIISNHVMV